MKKLFYLSFMLLGMTLVSCGPQVDSDGEGGNKEVALSEKELTDILTNIKDYTKDTIHFEETVVVEDKVENTILESLKSNKTLYKNNILVGEGENGSGADKTKNVYQTTMNDTELIDIEYYGKGNDSNFFTSEKLDKLTEEKIAEYYDITAYKTISNLYKSINSEDTEETDSITKDIKKITYDGSVTGTKLNDEMNLVLNCITTTVITKVDSSTNTSISNSEAHLHFKDNFLVDYKETLNYEYRSKKGDETDYKLISKYTETTDSKYQQGEKQVYTGTLLTEEDL